jgi:metal-sulfur cluster biosynthetic enzyme
MAASSGHPAAGDGSSCALAWVDMACAVNAAWNALTYVRHPELCLDLVSLGLVYDVRGEDGTILVEMTLARPGSAAGESLPQMAQLAVTVGVAGAAPVKVRVVADPPWSPAMIDQAAAAAAGWRWR